MSVLREIVVFLCGFVYIRQGRAQIVFPGACPDVSAMDNFEPSRYLGKWYEIEKYLFLFEIGGKCVVAEYTAKEDGVIGVINKQLSSLGEWGNYGQWVNTDTTLPALGTLPRLCNYASRFEYVTFSTRISVATAGSALVLSSGAQSEIEGEANQVSRSDEGKLSVRFPSLPIKFSAPYWIIDTDYDNYAVVWSCNDFGLFHTENAWILTRERNPAVSTIEKSYEALDKNNISRAYFLRTDQKNCPQKI